MEALSRLARLALPAALAAFLVLGTSPARAQDLTTPPDTTAQATFQANYDGQFAMVVAPDGTTEVDGRTFGDATFLPGSTGFFTYFIDPSDMTTMNNGSFLLFDGDNGSVFGTFQGQQSAPDASGLATISGTYTVGGGWLAFTNTDGSGAFSGVLDTNTGEITMMFQGTLTAPATPVPD
jgi:hypothetical protein